MKRWIICTALVFGMSFTTQAQKTKKTDDINAIKAMCGCYNITFKYTETFAPEIDYEKHLDYTAAALEWAELIVDEEDKLSIQHLLVINDSMVIKHWRQDWQYENEKVFYYDKDNNWVFKSLSKAEVAGQWTQKVYQVDDSPRYSGSATWIHADGKQYWENKTNSPLPRREYTKRKDYNVMLRGNRHEITSYGWLHEQDNDKVLRTKATRDELIAQEKGYNIYTKVPDEQCKLAKEWWKKNQPFWSKVRVVWDKIYAREGDLTLKKAVDQKPLFMHFYELEKRNASLDEIASVIEKFVINTTENVQGK